MLLRLPPSLRKQPRRPVVDGHQNVEVAVVVVVGVGRAAADHRRACSAAPDCGGHLFELLRAGVAEQMRPLRVGDARLHALDVVGDVTVGGEDVRTAVEIVVEEEAAEGQRQQRRAADRPIVGASSMNRPLPSLW